MDEASKIMVSMAMTQVPKLEIPTIYKVYVRIFPQNMALYGTVPSFSDPEIPFDGIIMYNHSTRHGNILGI